MKQRLSKDWWRIRIDHRCPQCGGVLAISLVSMPYGPYGFRLSYVCSCGATYCLDSIPAILRMGVLDHSSAALQADS